MEEENDNPFEHIAQHSTSRALNTSLLSRSSPATTPKKRGSLPEIKSPMKLRKRHEEPPPESDPIESISLTDFTELNRPNAKWRELGIRINLEPILDSVSTKEIHQIARKDFYGCHAEARLSEKERVRRRLEQIKINGGGKRPTPRPTDVAFSMMRNSGMLCNQRVIFGHVPGIAIGNVFQYKVQMKAVGLHTKVIAGIDYASVLQINGERHPIATSIVLSGWYADDCDGGEEMTYTGQGGNDLLGHHVQISDQKLVRGNLAMLNNANYGIPVRVIKKNDDRFIYDGLWDVLQMIKTSGEEGFVVYQYRLKRCPGQEPSFAKEVKFKDRIKIRIIGGENGTTIPVICQDYSRGMSTRPISVVNEVDDELPPGIDLNDLMAEANSHHSWKSSPEAFQFGTAVKFDIGVPPIAPAPTLRDDFQNDPHRYLLELNHGTLPYCATGTLQHAMCILYECGPWLPCPQGSACPLAITTKETEWQFQLFKTRNKGWGVRTLNRIPAGKFIMKYVGEVVRAQDSGWDSDDMYSFDMIERPDYSPDNNWLPETREVEAHYVMTGRRYGNLFRFVNHSCDPNCFIQPVLSTHLDRTRPDITIFAMRTILPGEEISYDYGRAYIEKLLGNDCKCGVACCTRRRDRITEI